MLLHYRLAVLRFRSKGMEFSHCPKQDTHVINVAHLCGVDGSNLQAGLLPLLCVWISIQPSSGCEDPLKSINLYQQRGEI
jgi:hypothetical protein